MGVEQVFIKGFKAAALAIVGASITAAAAPAQPLPYGGHPGCYAKMAYPATYRILTERVQGAPVVTYRAIPAVIEHYKTQVLVAPARTEHQRVAPIYRTVSRWTQAPGPSRIVTTPPVYRILTERRLISPAHLEWRPGGVARGFAHGGGYANGSAWMARPTGEVLCRIRVPARYATLRHRVQISAGRQITLQGAPHQVRTDVRVLVRPGRVIDHVIAAVYREVDATRVARPAGRQQIVSPGPARLVTRRVIATPARYGWAPMVCVPGPRPAHLIVRARPSSPVSDGRSYGQPALTPTPPPSYGEGASYGDASARPPPPAKHAFRPDEILAPTPAFPFPLVPAPYDVGHPAKH